MFVANVQRCRRAKLWSFSIVLPQLRPSTPPVLRENYTLRLEAQVDTELHPAPGIGRPGLRLTKVRVDGAAAELGELLVTTEVLMVERVDHFNRQADAAAARNGHRLLE